MTTTIPAGLTATQRAALLAAKQDGTTLYRGRLDLAYGYVPVTTLLALERQGLVSLRLCTTDIYSRGGVHYRGKRTSIDHAKLTEAGRHARTALQTEMSTK